MNEDFPDQGQRRAVCESQWDEGSQAVTRYEHVVQAVFNTPWAILPSVYATICELVRMRATGARFTSEEIQQRIGAAPVRPGAARNGNVAVLPLQGIIAQRMNLMTAMSGGTSTEQFGRAFKTAMSDPEVSAVVIDVDSPGGSVQGVQELWQTIFDARGQKPIVAQANSLMASAAYWIATAADEIVVTPSAEVGAIGVIAEHQDLSGAMEKAGVKPTLITAGKKKAQGNPYQALEGEALADVQQRVDTYYNMFVSSVAKGRGVRTSAVRNGFGEGGIVLANEAASEGMADRVATLEQTIERLIGRGSSRSGSRAETYQSDTVEFARFEMTDTPIPSAFEEIYGEADEQLELRARRLRLQ